MASKKETYFVNLGGTNYGSLNLDPEIYDAELATTLGVTKTVPTAATFVIRSTIKQLASTGKVLVIKLRLKNGTGDNEKSRTIPVICEAAKLATALTELGSGSSQSIQLGNLITKPWRIVGLAA